MRRGTRQLARTIILTITGAAFGLSITMCLHALQHSGSGLRCSSSKSAVGGNHGSIDNKLDSSARNRPFDENIDHAARDDSPSKLPPKSLIFVGIMTAQKFVDTRAYEIYSTWAQNLIANGSLAFFVSPSTTSHLQPPADAQLPLIRLANVDDSYPPQRKSFSMIKYFYEHLLDRYEWFMRADDDVYIRMDKLEVFLRSLNSSRPLFVGQAGLGTPEEYGQLNLGDDENYCMGGPGIVFSRETLRRIGPHIDECLGSMLTTHEDVEVGRCVKRFAGITCTWSYEMQTIFYNNQSGLSAYTGDLNVPEVHHSITLHPVKQQATMRKLHGFIRGLKLSDLRFRSMQLNRDVLISLQELRSMNLASEEEEYDDVVDFAQPPSLTKFVPRNHEDLLPWEFLSPNIAFCQGAPNCPRHNIESYYRYSTTNVIRQVMDIVNKYARQRGRILEYQDVLYGYRRVDPLHGCDYIFDLLLLYKKFKGRRVTIPVRRHAYLQQSFGRLQLIEDDELRRMESPESIDNNDEEPADQKSIHIILPLSGRSTIFHRFARLFENVCLKTGERVKLYVVLFPSANSSSTKSPVDIVDDDRSIRDTIRYLQTTYSHSHEIRLYEMGGNFSRGAALSFGASKCPADALLFFTDVDVIFTREFLHRLRRNTIRGRRVYFPIVFSQYALSPRNFEHRTTTTFNGDDQDSTTTLDLDDYGPENGYFRHFGYGLASLYRHDFDSIGGFDLTIRGWGMEDVELFDKFVHKMRSTTNSNLTIFRAPDPDLIHVYHSILCDSRSLPSGQYEMCRGSKSASLANVEKLSQAFLESAQFFNSLLKNDNGAARNFSKTMMMARVLKEFL